MERKPSVDNSYTKEVQALTRGLKLVEILSDAPEGLPLSTIAEEANLSKSSTHRLLNTLKINGYAIQDNIKGFYFPSMKFLELSRSLLQDSNLSSIARRYMEPLADLTGETIHFVLLDHDAAVYVEKVESPNTIRMYSRIGKRAPLHCTGVGKAILAFLPKDHLEEIVREKPLQSYTDTTIIDPDAMLSHLEEIRKRGYAIDNGEHENDILCIATPLFTRAGQVVGAISVSAVSYRVNLETVESWAPLLQKYTKQLNSELAYFFDRYA
jgi:DNA-binding IclR family transcriptional regulator